MVQRASSNRRLDELRYELRRAADAGRVPAIRRALQVIPGGYGEGDTIIGVSVPDARAIARRFADTSISGIVRLLRSAIHEERLVALLILGRRFGERGRRAARADLPDVSRQHRARQQLGPRRHVGTRDRRRTSPAPPT
jgi:hypothetical protein